MKHTIRPALVPGIAALALALSGCGPGHDAEADDGSASELSGSVSGGGATSQEKAQAAWRAGFQIDNPSVTINYDSVGSNTGRENFISEVYSFAATDSTLHDDEDKFTAAKERCGGEDPIQVPVYVSPIAVVFNLEDVDSLNLSAPVISNIFNGTITKWDDPAIAELNDGVELPGDAISPVHRQDDSGATENFTQYLAEAGEGAWTEEPDGLWPAGIQAGESADGTSGVLGAVVDGQGTVGYVDANAVGDLGVVAVRVGGEFNAPTPEGAVKVLAISPPFEGASETSMAVELDRTTTAFGTYPLLLVSYLIACQVYADEAEADVVKAFLGYIVSEEGQRAAADEAGSAPLDRALSEEAVGLIDEISVR